MAGRPGGVDRESQARDREPRAGTEGDGMSPGDKGDGKGVDEIAQFMGGVVWLNAKVLGLALGVLLALGIFVATNWLVIKGGEPVGPHLQLLGQYFLGYRVSFLGSLIGAAYGFAVGTLAGAFVGWVYNRVVALRGAGRGRSEGSA